MTASAEVQTDQPEVWEAPRPYFSSVGMAKWSDNLSGLDGVQGLLDQAVQADATLQGLVFTTIAAAEFDGEYLWVLAETLAAGEAPRECHACGASLSLLELENTGGGWVVRERWLRFTEAGAYGHAEAVAVEMPSKGLGFALPASYGQGGVYEVSCKVYEVTTDGPRLRRDLSKEPSSTQPYACE